MTKSLQVATYATLAQITYTMCYSQYAKKSFYINLSLWSARWHYT